MLTNAMIHSQSYQKATCFEPERETSIKSYLMTSNSIYSSWLQQNPSGGSENLPHRLL